MLSAEAYVLTVVEGGPHAVREVYRKAEADLTFARNSIAAEGIRCTRIWKTACWRQLTWDGSMGS